MGSFPLEEHSCRVHSLLSEMVSFPLGELGRLPFSWTSSVMSEMAAEDPKPWLDGDEGWQIVDHSLEEFSGWAIAEIDGRIA
jgi:hypothetical protein